MNRVSVFCFWDIVEVLDILVSFFFEGISDVRVFDVLNVLFDFMGDKEVLDLVCFYYFILEN